MTVPAWIATYRIQFSESFGFAEAAQAASYIADLGVSHVYLPPIFEARSSHGYDVTDPTRIRAALGDFDVLRSALDTHGLGVLLDIVPNHMAAHPDNPWWASVQRDGRDSPYADYFDIDFDTGWYRRFFDINELVALRQELPHVFDATHALAIDLVRRGAVQGLRIDHVDGLADPAAYLHRLRNAVGPDCKLFVEKILAPGERLPGWPVDGTTGYEFGAAVDRLLIDPKGTRTPGTFRELARDCKRLVLHSLFERELDRIGRDLEQATIELDVYRTYETEPERIVRWQLLTGAVMAKGVEDTAMYRYPGLTSLCEVGADPDHLGDFHDIGDRAGLNTTSTHDSKRSEDVRARLHVLSTMPEEWEAFVAHWGADVREADLLLQALIGIWGTANVPERIEGYAMKAMREAKVRTTWQSPDEQAEGEVRDWLRALCADPAFPGDIVDRIGPLGERNAIAMVVLKAIAPGIPDFYQGTEHGSFTLVDPDNRRPVNFAPGSSEKERVTRLVLRLRRERAELFDRGTYVPLGPKAFMRALEADWVAVALDDSPLPEGVTLLDWPRLVVSS